MDLKTIEAEINSMVPALNTLENTLSLFSAFLPAQVGAALLELKAFQQFAPTLLADLEKVGDDVEAAYQNFKAQPAAVPIAAPAAAE